MKCAKHSETAIGVCPYCGRALCPQCFPSPPGARLACSRECAAALERDAGAMQSLLRQNAQTTKASAFYCYLCGGLSAAAAVAAWFMLPSPFLIYFTGGCALVLFAAGWWYGRVAQQHDVGAKDPKR